MTIEEIRYEDHWESLDGLKDCVIEGDYISPKFGTVILVIPLRGMEDYKSKNGLVPIILSTFLQKWKPFLETN